MIAFGLPEWATIFALFFLLGIGVGRRWAEQPRAERMIPCLKVSAVVAALPILGGTIASLLDEVGIHELFQEIFPALVGTASTFLIFGLPFTGGALLWPRRCKPSVGGSTA